MTDHLIVPSLHKGEASMLGSTDAENVGCILTRHSLTHGRTGIYLEGLLIEEKRVYRFRKRFGKKVLDKHKN
jgi:hypothetical protein